jgi:ABC-type Zn uptake system ZnuABC Zn-binding protein ZnuA
VVLRNLFIGLLALLLLFVQACSGSRQAATGEVDRAEVAQIAPLTLPSVSAALPDGSRLRVVATTSIIGDIVQEVAGDKADVTVLMEPGQDPHSYEPAASDLADVAQAHIVFIGGWNLEEGLLDDLANIAGEVPLDRHGI